MKIPQNEAQDRLLDRLYGILCLNRSGIKEYDLYNLLKKEQIPPFHESNLSDELLLYRIHFLLFHLLYLLQDRLRAQKGEDLEIHCLNIQIKPWCKQSQSALEVVDPLRSYYMEVDRLQKTQRLEVEQMITDFWQKFERLEGRSDALAKLGLVDPVSEREIKSQFRKQAKEHHPDRGGDPDKFRQIAAAAETLLG